MNKSTTYLIVILLLGAITSGCIEAKLGQTATIDKTAGGLTPSVTNQSQSILVYCGAGMRKPMDEIGLLFEEQNGISVIYNYAGSNTLLSQMELMQEGDIYMPGATYYFDIAREKGFTDYEQLIAYHVPVIAVPKGNSANIKSLYDFTMPGVKIILGDAKATAIGKLTNKILEKNGIFEDTEKNVIARGATVNELVVYISMNQGDACIIWNDLIENNDKIEIIEIPDNQNIIKIIPVGTLTFTENKQISTKFVDFVASPEGKTIFEKHGFTTYPNEIQ